MTCDVVGIVVTTSVAACASAAGAAEPASKAADMLTVPVRPEIYAPVTLVADLSRPHGQGAALLGLFIESGEIMDDLYWRQTYGNRDTLLKGIADPRTREFVELNYGPWDRLRRQRAVRGRRRRRSRPAPSSIRPT